MYERLLYGYLSIICFTGAIFALAMIPAVNGMPLLWVVFSLSYVIGLSLLGVWFFLRWLSKL